MAGGAGSVGGSGGMGQQPMGNASAQPGGGVPSFAQPYMSGLGQPAGNASAQPYNPTGGAPVQSSSPSNPGASMGTMFGMLGQPPQSPNGPNQPSPLQFPQQPSPMGEMTAQPAVMPPGMQNQMPPPGMQPSQSDMQQKLNEALARNMPGMQQGGQQLDPYTRQLGFPPPFQTAQPMPPGFPTSDMPPGQQPQMPYGMSPLQNPFTGQNPYPAPGAIGQPSRPDLLRPMGQPMQGGLGALMSGMQPSKQQMKEMMRQQERMGPRQFSLGQPLANPQQQPFNTPQQYM